MYNVVCAVIHLDGLLLISILVHAMSCVYYRYIIRYTMMYFISMLSVHTYVYTIALCLILNQYIAIVILELRFFFISAVL